MDLYDKNGGRTRGFSFSLARQYLQRTPYIIIVFCLLVAIADIALFATFFSEVDEEAVLPQNDFHRIVHPVIHSPRARARARRKHMQHARAAPRGGRHNGCQCNPLEEPSSLVRCLIGPHGEQQTRIKNKGHEGVVLFKCARLDNGKRCQCCDCGSEEARRVFEARDIRQKGTCAGCESHDELGNDGYARFASGLPHQKLFELPLGLQHGYTSFSLNITVEGHFKGTRDNDPLVGFTDDTSQVWLAQRGDNGVWLTFGQPVRGQHNETMLQALDMQHRAHGSRADEWQVRVQQTNTGIGKTHVGIVVDRSRGAAPDFEDTQSGWRSSGDARGLALVAFRDDANEVYEFKRLTVEYSKIF